MSVRVLATAGVLVLAVTAGLTTTRASTRQEPPGGAGRAVTFARDIAPLVFDRCGSCHRPEGVAPFSLLSYDAARRRATQIAAVTQSRFMPPWKAETAHDEFIGQSPLTDAEIALIQRWVEAGAPEGDPRETPVPPQHSGQWQLGTPDLVVTMPEPYELAAEGTDIFRTFVLPLPVTATRYVTGLEFLADNARVVHHANIRVDRTPLSRQLDGQDDAPGYDGAMARTAEFPDGHFLAWTPGQIAPRLPKGLAWRLDPGTDLVFQLHLQPSGRPEQVRASIGLYFGNEPPERTPVILRLGRQDIDIPAGAPAHVIEDRFELPVEAEVLAVQPHAHTRARDVRAVALLPDGSTKRLIAIPDWDFRWQHVYRYREPFVLPRGTTLVMRYTYDNSVANPRNGPVPARAYYGWQTADEMGEIYIQLRTRDEADRAALGAAAEAKMMADDVVGYEGLIARKAPNADALHDDAAFVYLGLGRPAEAVEHFAVTARLRPRSPAARTNLAVALRLAGRLDEAVAEHQAAVALAPGQAAAHNGLGLALLQQGDLIGALASLETAVRLDPAFGDARYNLGFALQRSGRRAEAVVQLRRAAELNAGDAAARRALAWLLATASDVSADEAAEAVRHGEAAVRLTGGRDADAWDALAAACAAAGRFDEARRAIAAAIAIAGSQPALLARQARYDRNRRHRAP